MVWDSKRMKKKKIIHFIFNLGRGGAETMLVRVIKELDEYEHVIVTLFPLNHFGEELKCDRLICLNLGSLFSLPFAVFKFRKVVKSEKPDIVHTHLFWPTVIARASVPKQIPLITTIHAFIASSVEYRHWYIRFLDKLTYKLRKNIIIVVAKGALEEYFSFLNLKPFKAYALYTFVDVDRFDPSQVKAKEPSEIFRVVSVGALRTQKDHLFLVRAFEQLKNIPVELHIYGEGDLKDQLQQQIDETGVRVVLKNEVHNIEQVIPRYDLYVMSSSYEGFSLSVLEAMAMGMPLLLSDIPSFREQCMDVATYYSLRDKNDFIGKLLAFTKMSGDERDALGEKARQRAIANFTLPRHITGLRKIYDETMPKMD
jgi:glycosyltransferase involved in cell wall biosynthesis